MKSGDKKDYKLIHKWVWLLGGSCGLFVFLLFFQVVNLWVVLLITCVFSVLYTSVDNFFFCG